MAPIASAVAAGTPASAANWIQRGSLRFEAPCWECEGERIWGATLQILSQFGSLISAARRGNLSGEDMRERE